jgi:hypothetical protein
MTFKSLTLALIALLQPATLMAQAAEPIAEANAEIAAETSRHHSILIIYGDDACPESTGDEIVVCATEPESERYRVPKPLRDEIKEDTVPEQSWGGRVEAAEDYNRMTRPNSCSAVGMNGATGCASAALRQWQAERRAKN